MERVSAIPGVQDVGMINTLPLTKGPTVGIPSRRTSGYHARQVARRELSQLSAPNYFRAMSIPMVQGRTFTEHDNEGAPRAIDRQSGIGPRRVSR